MNIEDIRQQAQDENTSPEILAKLADSEDKPTRQYVVSNPNVSQETLFNLGVEFPKELLENPIFDLLLLENPNLISEIPIATLRSLIKQDNIPESFIAECAEKESDQDLLLGMTMNPKISRSILEKLIQSKHSEVVDAAKLHINWSKQTNYNKQKAIYDCFYDKIKNLKDKHDFLQDLSKLGLITGFVFQAFLNAYQVAIEQNLSRESSDWLYDKNEYSIILGNIASSIFTPNNILEQLVNVSDFRRQVSANPNVPQYLIKQLSQDEDREVQIAIAMNPNTSEEILLSMIEYNCSYIREAIASNKNASKKVIKQLLITNKEKESEEKIYALILANNITPPQKLVDKAINNQDLLRSLISNKDLDLKILDNISNLTKEKIELTSWRLASNSNTSVATLVQLSQTSDFYTRDYIRYLVATNPQTPAELSIEILEHFLNKEDGVNFCLIEAYLEINPSGISSTVERYLKHSSSNIVRLILLFNSYISKIDFKKHSESLDWLERYAIAQNLNTPLDIIQKLTNDANKVVRAAAKDNLKNQQIYESAIN